MSIPPGGPVTGGLMRSAMCLAKTEPDEEHPTSQGRTTGGNVTMPRAWDAGAARLLPHHRRVDA